MQWYVVVVEGKTHVLTGSAVTPVDAQEAQYVAGLVAAGAPQHVVDAEVVHYRGG